MNAGIVFNPGNITPVGLAFIQLAAGTPVYGNCLNAHILHTFRNFHNVDTIKIPAKPGFYGNRQVSAAHTGFGQAFHQPNIFQHACACALGHYFFYRAAKVYVEQVGVYGVHNPGAHGHGLLVAAKNLDTYGALFFKNVELLAAFHGIAYQPLATDKFSEHQVGAVHFAHGTKRRIAHILHGGEEQRKIGELYGAYVWHGLQR